jgi:hypothetical protein
MEWLHPLVLWIIAAIALIYFGLGLFNVEWHLRVRILLSLGLGALFVGAFGWPLVKPVDPMGPVTVLTGEISVPDGIVLILFGFIAGAVGTLVTYPLGSALGPFAAPAGAAVLAVAGGSMRNLLLYNQDAESRSLLYASLRWELLLWLAVCAAGLAGAFMVSRFVKTRLIIPGRLKKPSSVTLINGLIAAIASGAVVYFTIGFFAQDLRQLDPQLGTVIGLPGNGQIAFGVFVSIGLSAFLVKYFAKQDYYWTIIGAAALYFLMYARLSGSETLGYLTKNWPIDYLPHAIYGITPLQFASWGVLGALTGYWIAVRTLEKAPARGE